jgi:uncharacterized protein
MPRPNAQIITRLYEALETHDLPRILQFLDPKADTRQSAELPWGGTFHGHEGFAHFLGGVVEHLDSRVTIERIIDGGEFVAVVGRTEGRIKSSGEPFSVPLVHLYELSGGKIVSARLCIDDPPVLRTIG